MLILEKKYCDFVKYIYFYLSYRFSLVLNLNFFQFISFHLLTFFLYSGVYYI